MTGAAAVKELERAGWDARADTYGRLTGRITTRVAEPLLDAADVASGMRVLDIGTGPGYVAAEAVARGAEATGVDIAEEVLARAGARHPEVRFERADAEALPFGDGSFGAVVGNFAINHLPRPERAAAELARVTEPGGSVALSTWDESSGFPGLLVAALVEASVRIPDWFRLGEDRFAALLGGAGLEDAEVRLVSFTHRVPGAGELWHGMLGGSVRSGGLVMEQPEHIRARVRAAFDRLAAKHEDGGEISLPVRVKIARGRKP